MAQVHGNWRKMGLANVGKVEGDVKPEVGICELFHKIPCLLL
jgi:hypothetical protein